MSQSCWQRGDEPNQISCIELLRLLDWQRRLEFVNRHEFPVPTTYREIQETAEKLRVAVEHLQGGYLILLGDPGSGKSTLLTKTLVSLPCRLIRYYAFVPDLPVPTSSREKPALSTRRHDCIGQGWLSPRMAALVTSMFSIFLKSCIDNAVAAQRLGNDKSKDDHLD